jgi:hypothetical protein
MQNDPMVRLLAAGRARAKQILIRYKDGAYQSDDIAALAITQAIIVAMQTEENDIEAERNGEPRVEH